MVLPYEVTLQACDYFPTFSMGNRASSNVKEGRESFLGPIKFLLLCLVTQRWGLGKQKCCLF